MEAKVEIITIGDEVLMGQVVNNNAAYLGEKLTDASIPVSWMTVVGDQREQILDALGRAASRASAVIITGGLGPTPDDLTKACLMEFFEDELIFKEDLLKKVEKRFTDRGLPLPAASRGQAEFPRGAREIPNPNGTATGIHYSRQGCEWFALPGVPMEMQRMADDYVLPKLAEAGLGGQVQVKVLRTTGISESMLMERLTRLVDAGLLVEVAFLPRYFGVDVKLTGRGINPAEIKMRLDQSEKLLMPDLEGHFYGRDSETLPEVVGRLARERGLRIAVAESCTGGLIAKLLTDIPGSSDYFDRGMVTYSNEAKAELLGVPADLIEEHGAVSEAVAEAMAQGLRERSGVDVTVSTTGIAGPAGGTAQKPVGLVYIAVADRKGCQVQEFRFLGDREAIRNRAAAAALKLLHDRIKNLDF
jgi:nicotinamide-nucleotide amidase